MKVHGLVRRGNVYYFRRRVPRQLVLLVDKPVIVRSLKVKGQLPALRAMADCTFVLGVLFDVTQKIAKLDPKLAKQVFHDLLRQWMGSEELGSIPAPPADIAAIELKLRNSDGEDLRDIGAEFLMSYSDLREQVSFSDEVLIESIGHLVLRTSLEHAKQNNVHQSGRHSVGAFDPYFVDVFGFHQGIAPGANPLDSEDIQQLNCKSLSGIKQGEQGFVPVQSGSQSSPQSDAPSHTIDQIYAAYRRENENIWDFKRWYKFDYAHRILVHVFGEDYPASHITVANMRKTKEILTQLPSNASKKPQLRDKTIDKQIEIAKKENLDLISEGTINTHLSHMRLIFKWAKENSLVEMNPFDGAKVKVPKSKKRKRPPFSKDDLQRIFSSTIYTGMKSEHKWRDHGSLIVRNMRYWVPLIAAHTGMRLAEICQLNVADVVQIEDIWCIRVDENEGQSVKSIAALRDVPLHSALLNDWGFGDWLIKRLSQSGIKPTDKLFIEVQNREPGKYSDAFSKWFGSYQKYLDVKSDGRVFHSFRHTFIDLLRNSDVDEALVQAIVGHENRSVTSRYGSGHNAKTCKTAIEKIKMPFEPPTI